MANTEHVKIDKSVSLETIEGWIENPAKIPSLNRTDEDGNTVTIYPTSVESKRIVERLKFVRLRYKGYSVAEATDILGVNRQSGYNWQSKWNDSGIAGLYPGFDGGAPSKLTPKQKDDLVAYVEAREMCTEEIVDYVRTAYSVEYTGVHISRILKSKGLVYRRGYKIDYRRPANPEADLKKTSDWCWMRQEQMT